MRALTCPSCQHTNPVRQTRCGTCGATLSGESERPPRPRSAIWLDIPAERPQVSADDTTPTPLVVTLRDIDVALRSVPPPPLPSVPPPPPLSAPKPELVGHPDDIPVAKPTSSLRLARRASVRRAMRRARPAGSEGPSDVLVYDRDEAAREQVDALLAGFGFTVHALADIGAAWALASTCRLAAAFIDIAFDDSDGGAGVELCKRLKVAAQRRGDDRAPLLVLVSRKLAPVEQVTARLAGCDECLVKPVSRGAVAGALDTHGVQMPADARQA